METEAFRSSSSFAGGKGTFLLTSIAGYAASSAVLAIYTRFCLLKLAAAAAGPNLASVFLFALQSMSASLLAAVLMAVQNLAGLNRRQRYTTLKLPSSSASAMAGIMNSDQHFSREYHPLYASHFTFKFTRRLFLPTVLFSISAFTDMELLGRHANAETVFVIHCCTTMVVAVGEAICTQKGGVNNITKEAVASLLILIGGSVSYVLHESHFLLNNYSCALAFLFCKASELLYMKRLTVSMPDLRAWNFVIHRSLLSLVLVPAFIFILWNAGARNFHLDHVSYILTFLAAPAVVLSCLLTFAEASYGYQAVKLASATTCMVIEAFSHLPLLLFHQAVLSSPKTVLPSGGGLVSIMICILGAFMFIHFQMNPCSGYDDYLAFISRSSSPDNSFQELTDNLQYQNGYHEEVELKE